MDKAIRREFINRNLAQIMGYFFFFFFESSEEATFFRPVLACSSLGIPDVSVSCLFEPLPAKEITSYTNLIQQYTVNIVPHLMIKIFQYFLADLQISKHTIA